MTNIRKFIEFLSSHDYPTKFARAKNEGTCVVCGQPAKEFSTNLSAFEYCISSLCEMCQDTLLSNAYKEAKS